MSLSKQIILLAVLYLLSGSVMAVRPFYDTLNFFRPSRLFDQHFGLVLDPDDIFEPRWFLQNAGYLRPWRTDTSQKDVGSTVSFDKDKFQANLDVQQFKPEEISVKLTGDNEITVEGKHEEKQDEHGYISRHFIRRYELPKNCDMGKIQSKLSSDGVLTITAPTVQAEQVEHKEIPILQTGEPAKKVENKKSEEKNEL